MPTWVVIPAKHVPAKAGSRIHSVPLTCRRSPGYLFSQKLRLRVGPPAAWCNILRRYLRALCLWLLLAHTAIAQSPGLDCERAGAAAESAAGLPNGLLLAIGEVESGHFDRTLQRRTPWPWAIDVAGTPLFLSDATDAVAAARVAAESGLSEDVGCFQINLLYHPQAFVSLAEAFDPVANARYAARFLKELYARTGSWPKAVALYHSATPELGEPYAARVLATWHGDIAPVVPALVVAGVRIITPSAPGAAGYVLSLQPVPLPRVIVGLPAGIQ
jgi:Transglycosylase SLT domain